MPEKPYHITPGSEQRTGTFLVRDEDVPHGYCHCGCGNKTNIAKRTDNRIGHIKGEPLKFLCGHGGQRGKVSIPLADRFWSKVNIRASDECWTWTGPLNSAGYGHICVRLTDYMAHRVAYELAKGPIPNGLVIRHTCDNKMCCNPNHLITGTYAQNSQDAIDRGLTLRGEDASLAKLTDEQVIELRSRYARGDKQQWLAERFDITQSTVSAIVNRKTWRHIR